MLIATDLDGTLALGDKEDIQKLYSLFRMHNFTVVYVTGRDIKNFKKLTRTFIKEKDIKLIYPDYLVTLNGAKIYQHKRTRFIPIKRLYVDRNWYKHIKPGWNKKHCFEAFNATADKIRLDSGKPALIDVKYKPSPYYLETIVFYKKLDLIKQTFEEECLQRNVRVNVIFDYVEKHYVDMGIKVLDRVDKYRADIVRDLRDETGGLCVMAPSATNKGDAVDYVRKRLGLPKSQIIAAGDGGNDYHLLSQGFISVVVSNANPTLLKEPLKELSKNGNSNIIYASSAGAKGLLEGLKLVLDKSFPHCCDSSLRSVVNT